MPSGLISWLHTLIDDPELEYCILSPIPCERGGGAVHMTLTDFSLYKSTADRAQLIRCPSRFPHPLSEEPSQLPWGEIE